MYVDLILVLDQSIPFSEFKLCLSASCLYEPPLRFDDFAVAVDPHLGGRLFWRSNFKPPLPRISLEVTS
jgi:hypothetical protein